MVMIATVKRLPGNVYSIGKSTSFSNSFSEFCEDGFHRLANKNRIHVRPSNWNKHVPSMSGIYLT